MRVICGVRSPRYRYISMFHAALRSTLHSNMDLIPVLLFVFCIQIAHFTDPPCVIELECAECIPDNLGVVTSHRAANGSVTAAAGDELRLSCGAGHFLAYPRTDLTLVCEAGQYRVTHDGTLRHLLDLGCQESIFEDVLHQVDNCAPPLQGRAYQMRLSGQRVRHLATVCYDADAGAPAWLHMTNTAHNALPLPAHAHDSAPLSLLGNFNHMFDTSTRRRAERLYSDDVRMNHRLHELLKHVHHSFAEQSLTSDKLLSAHYFEDQNMRVTEFVSNRVGVWRSVAAGNLRHLQRDVGGLAARARAELHVYAGTLGVAWLRAGHARAELFLQAGRRFPVPRYVWAVLHAPRRRQAVALVVLNDPFVSVSEIQSAVFCESACARVSWLRALRAARRYEVPLYGLTFCCSVHNFTAAVPHFPQAVLTDVPTGNEGMLTDLFVEN